MAKNHKKQDKKAPNKPVHKVADKLEKEAKEQEKSELASDKVLMTFTEDKFYNDLTVPHFVAGEVYEVEGKDWINRWVKRGGKIVKSFEEAEEVLQEAEKLSEETEIIGTELNPLDSVDTIDQEDI